MEDQKVRKVLESSGVSEAPRVKIYSSSEGLNGKNVPVPAGSSVSEDVVVEIDDTHVVEEVDADEVRNVLERDFGYSTEKVEDYDRLREVTGKGGPKGRFDALMNPGDYDEHMKRKLAIKERELEEKGFEEERKELLSRMETVSKRVEHGMVGAMVVPFVVGSLTLSFGAALPLTVASGLGYIQAGNLFEGKYVDSLLEDYRSDSLD